MLVAQKSVACERRFEYYIALLTDQNVTRSWLVETIRKKDFESIARKGENFSQQYDYDQSQNSLLLVSFMDG